MVTRVLALFELVTDDDPLIVFEVVLKGESENWEVRLDRSVLVLEYKRESENRDVGLNCPVLVCDFAFERLGDEV